VYTIPLWKDVTDDEIYKEVAESAAYILLNLLLLVAYNPLPNVFYEEDIFPTLERILCAR
jgi:hypothetical protein